MAWHVTLGTSRVNNPRIGQLWQLGSQLELVVGWYDEERCIHATWIISDVFGSAGRHDFVYETTLLRVDERTDEIYADWSRVA